MQQFITNIKKFFDVPLDYRVIAVHGEVITIGDVLLALLAAVIGLWLVKWFSRRSSKLLTTHFHLSIGEAALIERLLYYILLPLVLIGSLSIAHIPITLFAFLGGAIAIGIGFGSQNLINNFISGLILLFERAIKVGDLIQVDQYLGRVRHVGFRSIRILTGDNIDVVVPNSYFLERPVINWSLTEGGVRVSLPVEVAYGSDSKIVAALLLQAAQNVYGILDSPKPSAALTGFTDSAMQFQIAFSIRLDPDISRADIESRVRVNILQLFKTNSIEIAPPKKFLQLNREP